MFSEDHETNTFSIIYIKYLTLPTQLQVVNNGESDHLVRQKQQFQTRLSAFPTPIPNLLPPFPSSAPSHHPKPNLSP